MPGVAFPPVGPVGRGSPPSPVLCAAKTTPCPSRVASLIARFPIPRLLHGVRGVLIGLVACVKLPGHARAFGRPVPPSGSCARRQVVLPRSRATPVKPCPALRPRWCPAHCHTAPRPAAFRRLQTVGLYRDTAAAILLSTTLPIRGSITRPASSLTPASYAHCWAGTWRSLLTCWLGVRQVGLEPEGSHPLGTNNQFHRISPTPKVSGLPWREHAMVRCGSPCAPPPPHWDTGLRLARPVAPTTGRCC